MFADNFRRYWREHIFGHFLPPVAAMTIAIAEAEAWPAAILPPIQMYRQALGWQEKQDTVSIDTMWIVAGTATGIAIGTAIRSLI